MLNYYQILGVQPSATATEIKKAYRSLAFKYHPDVSKNIADASNFSLIVEAYEVLHDTRLRNEYDLKFLYGKSFITEDSSTIQKKREEYKKYGNSKRNNTQATNPQAKKNKEQISFPHFEKFMFRTLLSFGIIGFVYSIRDLYLLGFDGINSLSGFFFSITFTLLLIVMWRNYKKNDK